MRALAAVMFFASGCAVVDAFGGGGGGADAGGSCSGTACRQVVARLPVVAPSRDLDLLFVVDNSDSMKEEQASLAASFPKLLEQLGAVAGGLPNLHVGVVSTDLGIGPYRADLCHDSGDGGLLQNTPRGSDCQAPTDRFLIDIAKPDGGRDTNFPGTLEHEFACIAQLGDRGCGVEQDLEAMKRALDGSVAANQGFLRADAFLGIIIISDEDDCSARDDSVFNPSFDLDNLNSPLGPFNSFRCTEFGVTCDGMTLSRTEATYSSCASRDDSYLFGTRRYADFLATIKDPTLTFVGVIAGDASPFAVGLTEKGSPILRESCRSANGAADPAVRLREFADLVPNHTLASICAEDLTPPITELARQLSAAITGQCLYGALLDNGPDPGLQPDCAVHLENGPTLPRCAPGGPAPCWDLVADAGLCPYSPGQLRVAMTWGDPQPTSGELIVECLRP